MPLRSSKSSTRVFPVTRKRLHQSFLKIQELFPFDFAGVLLGSHDTSKGLEVVPAVNISFPEGWIHEYFLETTTNDSVTLIQNFATYKPQYITETWEKHRQPKEIKSLCLDFGEGRAMPMGHVQWAGAKMEACLAFSRFQRLNTTDTLRPSWNGRSPLRPRHLPYLLQQEVG